MISVVKHKGYKIIKKTVRVLLAVFFICVCSFIAACSDKSEKTLWSGATMGTTYHITLAQNLSEQEKKQVAERVDSELKKINNLMSSYIKNSELMRFNQAPVNEKFQLTSETYEVLNISKEIYTLSDGALNIALSPLIELWGFGSQDVQADSPNQQMIDSALRKTNFKNLNLIVESNCGLSHVENLKQPKADCYFANKPIQDLSLNVSAVAKGYAVDHLSKLFKQEYGYQNFLIEIGGEVFASGQKADGSTWRLGLEKPDARQGVVQVALNLKNKAVATSGDYRNYFEKDGVRYSHTIDPNTGYPIRHNLASVSVVHDSVAYADAWSTALNVLGPKKGYAKAVEHNLAAYFIERVDKQFVVRYTPQFETFIAQ